MWSVKGGYRNHTESIGLAWRPSAALPGHATAPLSSLQRGIQPREAPAGDLLSVPCSVRQCQLSSANSKLAHRTKGPQTALWKAKHDVPGESSATLPLPNYGRVARHSISGRTLTTSSVRRIIRQAFPQPGAKQQHPTEEDCEPQRRLKWTDGGERPLFVSWIASRGTHFSEAEEFNSGSHQSPPSILYIVMDKP